MARGSVRQRGKQWYVVYPYRAADGAYKRKWERASALGFPNSKKGAEQALRARLADIDDGRAPTPATLTVAQYLETWLAGRRNVRESTLYNETRRIQTRIIPYIGHIELGKLSRADIRAWHGKLLADLKPSSVGHMHRTLNTALNDAVDDRLLRENPASKVRPPRSDPEEPRFWNAADIAVFLDACHDDQYGALWQLIIMTGLRRGEALALRWQDVDLAAARLTVNQTVTTSREGKLAIGPPKTRSSHRVVNLPPALVRALIAERDRQSFMRESAGRYWQETGLVFTRRDGTMLRPHTVSRALDCTTSHAGLPRLTCHQLRHTHATWLMSEKVHPKAVSERLGHSRVGITLDLYTHVTQTMQDEAVEALSRPLDSKDGSKALYHAQDS